MINTEEVGGGRFVPMGATCSLADYRVAVEACVRPTPEQINRFVTHVFSAHSWYKNLSYYPPGVPFVFFLNPFAGYLTRQKNQQLELVALEADAASSHHYSMMETHRYVSLFGHLDFGLPAKQGEWPLFSTAEAAYPLPDEVALAGQCHLTAVIHPNSHNPGMLAALMTFKLLDVERLIREWPFDLASEERRACLKDALACQDEARLKSLFETERQRQQAMAVQAIQTLLSQSVGVV